jgi:hypothetical protein
MLKSYIMIILLALVKEMHLQRSLSFSNERELFCENIASNFVTVQHVDGKVNIIIAYTFTEERILLTLCLST